VGALAGANGRSPRGNLCPGHPGAVGEDSPRLLLDRYAMKAGLQPQPLGHLVAILLESLAAGMTIPEIVRAYDNA
jgi:hypothetical protein